MTDRRTMPRVSIIIPTYNRADLLDAALTSVLSQTVSDFEVLVVDDGSPSDAAEKVVRARGDDRVGYVRLPVHRGVAAARNAGVSRSAAPYIAFLDDDDEWLPRKLEIQTAVLERSAPEVGGVYTARFTIDRRTGQASITRFGDTLFRPESGKNPITTSSLLIRRQCFEVAGPFDEELETGEDYDMWIRVGQAFRFRYIDEPLVKYCVHERSISEDYGRWTRSMERLLQKHQSLFARNRPGLCRRYVSLGVYYRSSGEVARARRAFLTAVRIWPLEPRSYLHLGSTLLAAERPRRVAPRMPMDKAAVPAEQPFVSIIMPCRQEAKWIGQCLDSVLANDYPESRLEILVVDGMSDDGTRDIVARYARQFECVRLVDNPRRTTPAALNSGIRLATGDVIMRMDAHVVYPSNYISGLVGWLQRSGVDNVGGHCVTKPARDTTTAKAIALALSHPFGVGNAHFRIGGREPRFVDTVPFGCYWRTVFERIGLFDETLVRNQDDEFNMRLVKAGGRILLVPEIKCEYVARESLGKVARMYFQYGYYKPLAAAKLRGVFTLRQLIPPLFVLGLAGTGILSMVLEAARMPFIAMVLGYAVLDVGAALSATGSGFGCRAMSMVVFPVLHISYGVGYLASLARVWRRGRQAGLGAAEVPLTR